MRLVRRVFQYEGYKVLGKEGRLVPVSSYPLSKGH